MKGLLATGILALLALLPIGFTLRYDEQGLTVKLVVWPFRIRLIPQKKKKEKPQEQEKEAMKKSAPVKKPAAEEKKPAKGGKLKDFIPMVRTALEFLGAFRRRLLVRRLEMTVTLAGGDPARLALQYGKAWAAAGCATAQLEEWFRIRKRSISMECDFLGTCTTVTALLYLTLPLGQAVYLAIKYGVRLFKDYMKIRNQKKAVQ